MKLDGWRDKPLHEQNPSRTDEKDVRCWKCLQTRYLQKETEYIHMAEQDQKLVTKAYRVTILKQQGYKKSRMRNERGETVTTLVNVQSWLWPSIRHNMIGLTLWLTCSKYGFEPAKHWYEHRAEGVVENQETKKLWDFNIKTDHVIGARRSDIAFINKKN